MSSQPGEGKAPESAIGFCRCWGLPEDLLLTSPEGFAPGSLWSGSLGGLLNL